MYLRENEDLDDHNPSPSFAVPISDIPDFTNQLTKQKLAQLGPFVYNDREFDDE